MKNRLAFHSSLLLAAFLAGLAAPVARAQVSTNLDALPDAPAHKGHAKRSRHGTKGPAARHRAVLAPPLGGGSSARSLPAPTPAGYTHVPSIPPHAPKPALIKPPAFPVILHPAVPAAAVTAAETSHSHTEPLPHDGLRILSEPNSTGMNGDTISAIRHYARAMAPRLESRLILRSYASLPGDDISMPRRIALSRALAVRSLLVQEGIATTRIYPIAQGRPDSADTAPAERLDITPEANPSPSADPEKGTKVP